MKRKALGRGLDSLLPSAASKAAEGLQTLPISAIVPNPQQPRRSFADEEIRDLAASLKADGLLQPPVVIRRGDGYLLVAGERRWRAALSLGWKTIPAIVRGALDDRDLLLLALVENVQREDLNPIEKAMGFRELQQKFHLTQEEIAEKMGKSRAAVANTLRLLHLPEEIQEMLKSGALTEGHARTLLGAANAKEMLALARRIVQSGLTVRAVEKKVQKRERPADPITRDAETKLSRLLHAPVSIERKGKGGTVRIRFQSEEELIRIYEHLSGGGA